MTALLPIDDYARIAPLFAAMGDHLAVSALLAGDATGQVYADDLARPAVALAWVNRRLYLAGSPGDASAIGPLRQLFAETIDPQAATTGMAALVLHYAPDDWERSIQEAILGNRRWAKAQRQFYTCDALSADWHTLLQQGFTLRPVDAALLADSRLEHREALMAEMCSERASVADFLAHSFGVCALRGDEIAGWCLSEYNSGDRCEVGIETLAPYQRRGLGTAMTLALVEEAFARGLRQVGWHCYAENVPSVATALRAGFVKALDYPVYIVWLQAD
jgi:RimJ/RimL family protein N-acetyltransferase